MREFDECYLCGKIAVKLYCVWSPTESGGAYNMCLYDICEKCAEEIAKNAKMKVVDITGCEITLDF